MSGRHRRQQPPTSHRARKPDSPSWPLVSSPSGPLPVLHPRVSAESAMRSPSSWTTGRLPVVPQQRGGQQ